MIKKDFREKLKTLPLTRRGMAMGITHVISILPSLIMLQIFWLTDIEFSINYIMIGFVIGAGLEFLILKKWFEIAKNSKETTNIDKNS